jgi:molecular chaperone GrpE
MSENNHPLKENPNPEFELEDDDAPAAASPFPGQEEGMEADAASFADSVHNEEADEPFSMEPEGPDLSGIENSSRITELEEQLAQSKDQTLRALAELDNVRKRAVREREDAGSYAITRFARSLLDVADNLRRALDAVPEEHSEEHFTALITGIEATERELLKAFEQNGLQKLEPMDEKFDPNFHEVMFEAPVPGKENGTVIQIVEPGYTIKDRLLRPARVGVAKNPDEAGGATDGHILDEEA